ncbi:MAG TPA: rhodanese-like domain-containing protein [Candidatus Kapabacteria bacterium]|nr:rhodanese-like domain-containing protein [Candidatus Kapabacteria bacterium]
MTRFRRILALSLGAASLVGAGAFLALTKTGRGFRWALDRLYLEDYPDITTVTPDALAAELGGRRPPLLLDTRTPEEFSISHLANAQLVSPTSFDRDDVDDLERDRPIVVYCAVGQRSARVARTLKELGFTSVRCLYGGIILWYNEGYPVYRDMRPVARIHPYNAVWGQFITRRGKTTDVADDQADE